MPKPVRPPTALEIGTRKPKDYRSFTPEEERKAREKTVRESTRRRVWESGKLGRAMGVVDDAKPVDSFKARWM